jgi:predicted ATP-binding protein involved in virulence
MNIERIDISNFMGYESKSFEFDKDISVIVGNNTAGKTSVLKALQIGLGAFLKSIKSLPSDKAYSCNFTQSDVFLRYNPAKKDFFANDGKTRIDVQASVCRTTYNGQNEVDKVWLPISWWRELRGNQTTHSQECAGELISYVNEMESKRVTGDDNINTIYPIVLSFGANRIDNQYRTATKTQERASKIAKAYKSALKETVDFQGAFDWIYRYDYNLKKGTEFPDTNVAFINALTDAIPAMSDVTIDTKNSELIAKLTVTGQQPSYHTFRNMSDGFKSVICIVAEIAHRCIELNGFLGADAVKKTPGVVMIDELDLYLHPRWQRHILDDLKRAFPLIQFIVSSHSPFIIQSVLSKNIITLDGVNDMTDPIYRSIEEIVLSEMNMETLRSREYNDMLHLAEQYYKLVKLAKGCTTEAKEIKQKLDLLEEKYSEDPAYVALLRAERSSI